MEGLVNASAEVLAQRLSGGLVLMGLGMAVVFVFLTLLVLTTKLVSKVVGSIERRAAAKAPKVEAKAPASSDAEIAVAIAVAVSRG